MSSFVRTSEKCEELYAALAQAQGKIGFAKLSGYNSHRKNNYAEIDDMFEAIKPILQETGLACLLLQSSSDEDFWLTMRITHASGQFLESSVKVFPEDKFALSLKKELTTASRNFLQYTFGIYANEAGEATESQQQEVRTAPVQEQRLTLKGEPALTEKQMYRLKKELQGKDEVKGLILETYGSFEEIPKKHYESIIKRVNPDIYPDK